MVSKFMTIGILATAIAGKPCTYVNATANTYDYIIVGGGLTGLVAASRLSENSNGQYQASIDLLVCSA